MPKVNIARKSTLVDMTPMSDVAFLLVTFFMLTTKFKPQEPVQVTTPSAISTTLLPESNVAMATISKDGRVFFGVDNEHQRLDLIQAFNKSYNLGLSEQEMTNFTRNSSVGMPLKQLKQFLDVDPEEVHNYQQKGIPIDSADGELGQWIRYTRNTASNPGKLKFVIKADDGTKYKTVNRVLDIFKKQSIHQLHLITSMKSIPKGTPAYESSHEGSGNQ